MEAVNTNILTLEGVVKRGQIWLKSVVNLPENTKVYIIVPDIQVKQRPHIFSPRLVHPEQAADFALEMTEEIIDAHV